MNPYIAAEIAIIGSILSGILGWLDWTPVTKFDLRQFLGTIIRAIIAGVGVATTFIAEPNITVPIGYFIAFGLGVAADAGGKRLNSVYTNLTTPLKTSVSDTIKPSDTTTTGTPPS